MFPVTSAPLQRMRLTSSARRDAALGWSLAIGVSSQHVREVYLNATSYVPGALSWPRRNAYAMR